MRQRIHLENISDIQKFLEITSTINEDVYLEDNTGFKVSAKSLLGALASIEWTAVYCHCSKDISAKLLPWIV